MDVISSRLMGGLGNMLFQISVAYSISLRDNKKMICDTRDMVIPHKPYTFYTDNIFRKIKFTNEISKSITSTPIHLYNSINTSFKKSSEFKQMVNSWLKNELFYSQFHISIENVTSDNWFTENKKCPNVLPY